MRFAEYAKKLWDSGKEEFGPCAECGEMLSRKEIGRHDFAANISQEILWHYHCCPCQLDQTLLKDEWEELEVIFANPKNPRPPFQLPTREYVGILFRCPFCLRSYDDNGQEVKF